MSGFLLYLRAQILISFVPPDELQVNVVTWLCFLYLYRFLSFEHLKHFYILECSSITSVCPLLSVDLKLGFGFDYLNAANTGADLALGKGGQLIKNILYYINIKIMAIRI